MAWYFQKNKHFLAFNCKLSMIQIKFSCLLCCYEQLTFLIPYLFLKSPTLIVARVVKVRGYAHFIKGCNLSCNELLPWYNLMHVLTLNKQGDPGKTKLLSLLNATQFWHQTLMGKCTTSILEYFSSIISASNVQKVLWLS